LTYATAIGADSVVNSSNTIALGRPSGSDTVLVYGELQVDTLSTIGTDTLCRNTSNRIAQCSSSLRYKKNVVPFSLGLSFIKQLKPILFEWRDGQQRRDIGFGAEDVEKLNPLFVTYNSKGEVEGVKYEKLTTVLVNAVNEQQAEIERQQKQIEAQQAEIKKQQAEMKKQQAEIKRLSEINERQQAQIEEQKKQLQAQANQLAEQAEAIKQLKLLVERKLKTRSTRKNKK
ncbi:MAG: tail fiber domain-containing protein, partial [Pyrinomonadaceae bacterium]